MYPTDVTGELCRQRIADLHTQADRQRLARNLLTRPPSRAAGLRQLATAVLLAAAPVAVLVVEAAGTRIP
jgi:hypothetical protein